MNRIKIGFGSVVASLSVLLLVASASSAATYSMTGSIRAGNPSAGNINAGVDIPNPNRGTLTVSQGAGGSIFLPEAKWQIGNFAVSPTANGLVAPNTNYRTFGAFSCCAQLTFISQTYNRAATFAAGAGAGAIDFCPQATGCTTFTAGTFKPALIKVTPTAARYGGVFRLLRDVKGGVWFIAAQTPNLTLVFQSNTVGWPRDFSGGITNHRVILDTNLPGKVYVGGALTAVDGQVMTLGAYVGAAPTDPPDGTATGFKMTTGSIFVIDATPSTANGGPFSSTTSGYDNRTAGGNGSIKLVGGSVAHGGSTGNNFFRVQRLTMTLPEPGASLGLAVGMFLLVGLARTRSRN
jgi:hypothetical protein